LQLQVAIQEVRIYGTVLTASLVERFADT